MVKPALPYLDIMREAKDLAPNHPLACYQVGRSPSSVLCSVKMLTSLIASENRFRENSR